MPNPYFPKECASPSWPVSSDSPSTLKFQDLRLSFIRRKKFFISESLANQVDEIMMLNLSGSVKDFCKASDCFPDAMRISGLDCHYISWERSKPLKISLILVINSREKLASSCSGLAGGCCSEGGYSVKRSPTVDGDSPQLLGPTR